MHTVHFYENNKFLVTKTTKEFPIPGMSMLINNNMKHIESVQVNKIPNNDVIIVNLIEV